MSGGMDELAFSGSHKCKECGKWHDGFPRVLKCPNKKASCNRHSNCEEERINSPCCFTEDCEDCFGK